MAWTATAKPLPVGFEYDHTLGGHGDTEAISYRATPGASYTKGQMLVRGTTSRLAYAAAAGASDVIGICHESKTIPAATVKGHHTIKVYANPNIVWRAALLAGTFLDDAAAALVDANNYIIAFTANLTYANAAVDNSVRGHALVCYDGPGKGEWRTIQDYDAAGGGTGNQQCTVDEPFNTTITTDSKFVIMGTGTDGQGIVEGSLIDLAATPTCLSGKDITGPCLVHSMRQAWEGVLYVRIVDLISSAP